MGCFWGAEKMFWALPGVYSTAVGYAAGFTPNPTYREVCSGMTGHNEVVQVVFDPRRVSYDVLLRTFWENHDPTQGMRQGNDVGTQYRTDLLRQRSARDRPSDRAKSTRAARAAGMSRKDGTTPRAGVLLRGGVPPAVPREEPDGYCGSGTGVSCPVGVEVHEQEVSGLWSWAVFGRKADADERPETRERRRLSYNSPSRMNGGMAALGNDAGRLEMADAGGIRPLLRHRRPPHRRAANVERRGRLVSVPALPVLSIASLMLSGATAAELQLRGLRGRLFRRETAIPLGDILAGAVDRRNCGERWWRVNWVKRPPPRAALARRSRGTIMISSTEGAVNAARTVVFFILASSYHHSRQTAILVPQQSAYVVERRAVHATLSAGFHVRSRRRRRPLRIRSRKSRSNSGAGRTTATTCRSASTAVLT